MEKPTIKLVGSPCGQHGQYTFYKAIKYTGTTKDQVLAVGDFFFVKLWQDSELVNIGELQLLWTDRVSDHTLVSLRLYFLPENTPDGRGTHGQDEVLAINEKVVVRVEDLLTWVCRGDEWSHGLRAVWRGACAVPMTEPTHSPLHSSRLDFTDVDKEKSVLEDPELPGVVVFSYPRYCRYRAMVRRLDGVNPTRLRESLVCALGGYAAPTNNTRILYCKDTFEYPELEGHEFVCNHLAPRLKGRPRGRRRRRARSHSPSPERSPSRTPSEGSEASEKNEKPEPRTPPRALLRNGGSSGNSEERTVDKAFMSQLRAFHRDRSTQLKMPHQLKQLSLRGLYQSVVRSGGYERVCREKGWRTLHAALLGRPASPSQVTLARRHYERLLLPFEKHERRNGSKWWKLPKLQNGNNESESPKENRRKHNSTPIATIDITAESPVREIIENKDMHVPRLSTPPPSKEIINLNSSGSDIVKKDEDDTPPMHAYDPSNLLTDDAKDINKQAADLNQEFLDSLPKAEDNPPIKISLKPVEKLIDHKPPSYIESNQSLLASKLLGNVEKIPGLTGYLQKQSLTDLSSSLLEIAARQNSETPASLLAEIANKQSFSEMSNTLLSEITAKQSLGDTGNSFLKELAHKQTLGEINTSFLLEIAKAQQDLLASSSALSGLSSLSSLSGLSGLSDKLVNYATLAAAGLTNGQLPNGTMITVQQGPSDRDKQQQSGNTSGTVSPTSRPAARSSLRSVRVKPTRTATTARSTPSASLRPDSASSSPPVTSTHTPITNFGINYIPPTSLHNQVSSTNQCDGQSDDEIIEVPYKPNTPEIIDLDEYDSPGSPQVVKKKKLDILKERGLEVTAVSTEWPSPAPVAPPIVAIPLAATLPPNPMLLNPTVQQQIMTQAQFFQMYNTIMPQGYTNGLTPPKVIQGKSIYGSSGPEKTVYGNPKDPFMPPPHVLQGTMPLKQSRCLLSEPRHVLGPDVLDLSSKEPAQKPAVEIVRVPSVPLPAKSVPNTPPQNLSSKSYSLIDGKAMVGSNLEITLVRPKTPQATTPPKSMRPRQKRSSTGQFMSNKSPSSRESPNHSRAYISPSGIQTSIPTSTSRLVQDMYKSNDRAKQATNIVIPSYQMSNSSRDSDISPTSSTSSRDGNSIAALTSSLLQGSGGSLLQNPGKVPNLAQFVEMQAKSQGQNLAQFMDPSSVYMSALYSSLAGQLAPTGISDQHQLAVYQNLISSRLMRNYPGLLNMSSVTSTPTTKN